MFQASLESSADTSHSFEGSPKPKPRAPETQPADCKERRARVLVYCREGALLNKCVEVIGGSKREVLVGCVDDPSKISARIGGDQVDVVLAFRDANDDFETLARNLDLSTPLVSVEQDQQATAIEHVYAEGSSRLPTEVTHLGVQGLDIEATAQQAADTAFYKAAAHRMWAEVAIRGAAA